jgi:isopenicillin-N N-acyltransferase-like protein
MDWLCPGYNQKLAEQLDAYHGHIDEVSTIHDILPTVQTGNLHIVVYDLTQSLAFVSFMRTSTGAETEPLYAYERQFIKLDMTSIFAVTL